MYLLKAAKFSFTGIFIVIFFSINDPVFGQTNPKAQIEGDLDVIGLIKQSALPVDSQDVVTKEHLDKMLIKFGLTMVDKGITRLLAIGYSPKDLLQNGVTNLDTFLGEFYAGGIIVHMFPDGSGLTARTIAGVTASWGCNNTDIPRANRTAIGTGQQNTADILAECRESNFAAKIANNYVYEGYDDWFLPSTEEVIACLTIPKNSTFFYDQPSGVNIWWSSTQFSSTQAFARDYNVGVEPVRTFSKLTQGTVIAMRYFD